VPATDHPQMTSKAVVTVFRGISGSALAQDKLLQPEYRHNDCNDCTTLVTLLVSRYVGMSLGSFKSALMEI